MYYISLFISICAYILTYIEMFSDPEEHSTLFSMWGDTEQIFSICVCFVLIIIGIIRDYRRDGEIYS